ncbi:MAG: aspartate-semialdehyde dehydrogenase [Desulfosalsimonas sp.]
MLKVAFIGWRGMVGSVLMERMREQGDFAGFKPLFASTSQVGQSGPNVGMDIPPLADAFDVDALSDTDIIVTCQGSDYTKKVYPELREKGWKGFWIDASSALRMAEDSIIVLDPVNREVIGNALDRGIKNFIGGNCTVSLMLMAAGGLFKAGLVEWMTSMTYQAASGAGAKNMRELVAQMNVIGGSAESLVSDPSSAILDIDRRVMEAMKSSDFPVDNFGFPLAGSLLPWIDSPMDNGQTREEWKGFAETNKILQNPEPIPIDGICVRIGAMRSHSQAIMVKLSRDVPEDEIRDLIASSNQWAEVVPNTKEDSLARLTPAAVSGSLIVPVGRIRKMNLGPKYLSLFTAGDQLLWGAAEPIRRMFKIALEYLQ